jgi:hypothetical protein
MKDVTSLHKWYAHDQFKPENQLKEVKAHAFEEAVTSKLHHVVKKYPDVDTIKWSKDCTETDKRGKHFLTNWIIQRMPLGMRNFHDWYLHIVPMKLNTIQACIPTGTFGTPAGEIVFDFNDIQTCFHLRAMEMNLIRTWYL